MTAEYVPRWFRRRYRDVRDLERPRLDEQQAQAELYPPSIRVQASAQQLRVLRTGIEWLERARR